MDSTIQEITESKEAFKKFLDFQSKFYKYPFEDSLLIYAQNPNANACATYKQWNSEKVGRRIHSNPKTIYVFDGNTQSQIKYLFELADTHGKAFQYPNKITIPEKYQKAVLKAYSDNLPSKDFNLNFKWCIEKYVENNMDMFINEFKEIHKNHENAELLQESDYRKTLTDSIGYTVCQRFFVAKGIYDNPEAGFTELHKFNSKEMILLLGCATQNISKKIIAEINHTLVNEEKRIKNEREQEQRNDNSREIGIRERERNLSGYQENNGRNGGTDTAQGGKIRQDVGDIHGGKIQSEKSISVDRGNVVGDAGTSPQGGNGNDDGTTATVQETEPKAKRGIHGDTPLRDTNDGVGRGNNAQRDSLQAEIDKVESLKIGDKIRFEDKELIISDIETQDYVVTGFDEKKEVYTFSAYILSHENGEVYKKAKQMDLINKIEILERASEKKDAFLLAKKNQKEKITPDNYENFDDYIEAVRGNVTNYREPFVIIEWSESSRFMENEILTFTEADKKFKEVEKLERQERSEQGNLGGYNKTKGYLIYLDDVKDKELSSYLFRYDIGDYSEQESGLYNHINSFWEYYNNPKNQNEYITKEDYADSQILLKHLKPYTYDEQKKHNKENEKYLQEENQTQLQATLFDSSSIPETPKSNIPEPFVFEKFKDIEKSLDYSKYNDGDIIGYDLKGAKYTVTKMDTHTFINTETVIAPNGDILGFNKIPEEILEQIKSFHKVEEPKQSDNLPSNNEQKEENSWKNEMDEPQESDLSEELPIARYQIMETQQPQTENYIIQTDNDIGIASGKTKYKLNAEAIKLLKEIESNGRYATAEEQKTLAKFSGFGDIPQAFAPDNEKWTNEYKELRQLLTEDEYNKASASTLNAHYTGTDVIEAMYEGVKRLGFKGGNIIDPALGTGHFMGKMPEDIKNKSNLYGVEIDDITARIARQLYPKAKIEKNGYEKTKYPDNFFDLAISNVPFGNYGVHDVRHNKKNLYIHDYFFAKTLDKVKPNGVIAFITSKGTMDKANTGFRKYLAERAELLGAIRLPNNTFKESANTEVTTDIIFLKKRDNIIDANDENWIYTGYHTTGRKNEQGNMEQIPLNQYFIDNPKMMLGEMKFDKSMYGNEKETALFPFSKPSEGLSKVEFFVLKFEELRQKYDFNTNQKMMLQRFENHAIKNGSFTKDFFTKDFIMENGGYNRFNQMFDYKLDDIIKTVNYNNMIDKSEIPLKILLKEAINNLPENIVKEYATIEDLEEAVEKRETIPADPTVKNYSYTIVDDKIYQREDSIMLPIDVPEIAKERMKALIELRDTTKFVIDLQLDDCSDKQLQIAQDKLLKLYDDFTMKFKPAEFKAKRYQGEEHKGRINDSRNYQLFGDDAEFPLLSSLENIKDDGSITKADIFTKRTIKSYRKIDFCETSTEALAVSLYEKGCLDLEFMASLTNKNYEEVIDDLKGIIFKNPLADAIEGNYDPYKNWETMDEYLSGDVVEKLEQAKQYAEENDIYKPNVEFLEKVQPTPLQAHEISVGIGSRWIDEKYYKEFISVHFKPDSPIDVAYSNYSNEWRIEKPNNRQSILETNSLYGTKRMDAYELFETLLNQRSPKIYDIKIAIDPNTGEEKVKYVINKPDTIAIKDRATKLQDEFQKWIFDDPDRRQLLVEKYNRIYNSERERQFDGSFLRFEGMSPTIQLRDYQKNAVARILFGGNTLLVHCVGAGKTNEMVAGAMEMKRMGIASKSMIVVPNHLVNQWSNDFKKLYPNANILAATKRDFVKSKRQRFCARAATGDWDAIIIGHSSFGKIPISIERQEAKIKHDIKVAKQGLSEANQSKSEKLVIKLIERNIRGLEYKLKKLMDKPKDNVINFENLGVDALFVDEADEFKNKYIFTKMTNVAGMPKAASDRSTDMELKCDFINEQVGSERNVVFATGTPISNSLAECYTMQSYLMKKKLEKYGLEYFDNWKAQFGEVVTSLELDVSGKGFKMRERFSKFKNVPELLNLYRQIADIQTADMLKLPVPIIHGDKPQTIASEASPAQKAFIDVLVQLSKKISDGEIPPERYNMLCVTNDGRLGALDMQALNLDKIHKLGELYDIDTSGITQEDYKGSKINECANNVYNIYKETEKDRLTQIAFCDVSTPKNDAEIFSVYNEIKKKLIFKGADSKEIAFIHQANTDSEKEALFSKVRSGEIRILLGSTAKCGAGTNIQDKLVAAHNIDAPWRPRDLEQRSGRIVRFGNNNEEVRLFNYVTKGTFDSYLWQILETKQKAFFPILSGKAVSRTLDDIDTMALTYAEVKAIATDNPKIRRKMELEIEVNRLKILEQQYIGEKHNLQDKSLKQYPQNIFSLETKINKLDKDIGIRDKNTTEEFHMQLGKKDFTDKNEALNLLAKAAGMEKYADKQIGNYKGFQIIPLSKNDFLTCSKIALKGADTHIVELSDSESGNLTRIENVLNSFNEKRKNAVDKIIALENQIELANTQLKKPFEYAKELSESEKELNEINAELDIGKEDISNILNEQDSEIEQDSENQFCYEEEVIEEECENEMDI